MEVVLVPAAVAAVVTLLIEYFAKPHLEARKERVLHRHRSARQLREAFARVSFEVGRFTAWEDEDDIPDARLAEIAAKAEPENTTMVRLMTIDDVRLNELQLAAVECLTSRVGTWIDVVRYGIRNEHIMGYVTGALSETIDVTYEIMRLRWWQRRKRRELRTRLTNICESSDS